MPRPMPPVSKVSNQRQGEHWKDFFAKSKKYTKVGRVQHRPIDPASPIPEPCKEKKPDDQPTKETKEEARPQNKHEEL